MGASTQRGSGVGLALLGTSIALFVACLLVGALASAVVSRPGGALPPTVGDIPPQYLAAYRQASQRFLLGDDGWSYLAAIGKVESDHGRSAAPGVSSGQNAHGCCAGPMQFHNAFGSGAGTWGAFKVDGDGDGRSDIYDPEDAIATAARYLRASGAPDDWPNAVWAYNHAGWYVDQILRQAAGYRLASTATPPAVGPSGERDWLTAVPGFPGERCDTRIVPDVVALARTYGLRVTDCFGGAPHAIGGEHPLGLAVDAVPVDGDWRRTERLALGFGWRRACAATGCTDRGPFRQILYNGFPGHGDPRYSRQPHLHLSWQHGPAAPFARAAWVRTLLDGGNASPR